MTVKVFCRDVSKFEAILVYCFDEGIDLHYLDRQVIELFEEDYEQLVSVENGWFDVEKVEVRPYIVRDDDSRRHSSFRGNVPDRFEPTIDWFIPQQTKPSENSERSKQREEYVNTREERASDRVTYFEHNGVLWFLSQETAALLGKKVTGKWVIYETSGEVPYDVVDRGEDAVRKYVKDSTTRHVEGEKERMERWFAFAEDPDFPVSIRHDRKVLRGKVISVLNNTLVVRLEQPYQGERSVHYGFGSTGSIFSDSSLSEDAIRNAQKLLVRIYDEQLHYEESREVIDLAKWLKQE